MSDGQGTTSQTDQGTTSTTDGGAGGAGGAAAPAFYEGFKSADLKTHPSIQRYADPEALAGAYVNLEKRIGIPAERQLILPENAEDKDAMAAIWRKLGAPEKPEDYKFTLADGSNDTDKAMADRFAAYAHEHNVPKSIADAVVQFWEERTAETLTAQAAMAAEARAAGETALRKEWGAAFDQKGQEIGRLLLKLGGADVAKALEGEGLANHPQLAMVLGKALDLIAEPDRMTGAAGEGARQDRALTPVQARAKVRELDNHPALRDRKHVEHARVLADRTKYARMADNLPVEDAR
jgi:hypothetical protein